VQLNDVSTMILTGLINQVPGDLLVFILGSLTGALYERIKTTPRPSGTKTPEDADREPSRD
jgi:hypothetical protein